VSSKTVLITGGATGIGRAIAQRFADNGYSVALTYHTSQLHAQKLVEQLRNKGVDACCYQLDVSDYLNTVKVTTEVINRFKHIDCLICNSGIACVNMLSSTTMSQYDSVMDVNMRGVYNCCKAVTPYMVDRGSGSIVNISSVLGLDGCSCESVYSASKGAVIAFSLSLAKELGASNIRVNCVCPGVIDTAMNGNLTVQERDDLSKCTLLGRFGTVNEVADTVLFTAEASYVTGTTISVDGGLSI